MKQEVEPLSVWLTWIKMVMMLKKEPIRLRKSFVFDVFFFVTLGVFEFGATKRLLKTV